MKVYTRQGEIIYAERPLGGFTPEQLDEWDTREYRCSVCYAHGIDTPITGDEEERGGLCTECRRADPNLDHEEGDTVTFIRVESGEEGAPDHEVWDGTLDELFGDNYRDQMEDPVTRPDAEAEMQEIRDTLAAGLTWIGGGGAAPTYRVSPRKPEPEDDDYVISDAGNRGYYCSRLARTCDSWDDTIEAISDDMESSRCWPDVWYYNDHGNLSLLALRRADDGTVTAETVADWV